MALHQDHKGSQLFTVRVWVEELDGDRTEWRGRIQRVMGGETLFFRDWGAMETFVLACLEGQAERAQREEIQT